MLVQTEYRWAPTTAPFNIHDLERMQQQIRGGNLPQWEDFESGIEKRLPEIKKALDAIETRDDVELLKEALEAVRVKKALEAQKHRIEKPGLRKLTF